MTVPKSAMAKEKLLTKDSKLSAKELKDAVDEEIDGINTLPGGGGLSQISSAQSEQDDEVLNLP